MEALPRELTLSIDQLFGDLEDADSDLDGPTFNLENAMNELFPSEASLEKLDLVADRLDEEIVTCRNHIKAAEAEAQSSANAGSQELAEVQGTLGELFTQIHHLKSGATESQSVVKDITRDIKTLDTAKTNITTSMTAVKRFQMLLNGFDQLSRLAKAKKYRETAQSLLAIHELQSFFKSYTAIERINAVFTGTSRIQSILREQIMRDFESALSQPPPSESAAKTQRNLNLMEACAVVDALDDDTKTTLLDWYSTTQLRDYKRIFRPGDEAGQLDNMSRRFSFLKRILKQVTEEVHGTVFPEDWNVPAVLTAAFSIQTKDDLKTVLSKSQGSLNVNLLLDCISQTSDFERDMSKRFHLPFASILELAPGRTGSLATNAHLTSVFEPHLGIFVEAQDRSIAEMIQTYRNQPRISTDVPRGGHGEEPEDDNSVLSSSAELFYFYRETLERCAQLSVRSPFLDLCNVFRKWLRVYAEDVLAKSLSRPLALSQTRRSSSDSRLSMSELYNACSVVNTADYCSETSAQLEERLKEKIHPDFRDRVSLESEKELFLSTISAALTALLREMELNLEPAFQSMSRLSWREADLEHVSSESEYVSTLRRSLEIVVDVVRDKVDQRKYFRSFCDRVVTLVLAKFTQTVIRCRPISTMGAEQLLLDLSGIKQGLLKLPQALSASNATYTRFVNKGVGRIETLLKVVMASEHPAEEFVAHYLVLIPCQSFSDFQKMLDIKGVRRADQNELLDVFLTKTSTMPDLSDTSFMSSLDMDPNLSASLVVSPQPSSSTLPPASASAPTTTGHSILAAASAFGSLPMWATSSRDGSMQGSRSGTPLPCHSGASGERTGHGVAFAEPEGGSSAGPGQQQQQQKFGSKLGRLFRS